MNYVTILRVPKVQEKIFGNFIFDRPTKFFCILQEDKITRTQIGLSNNKRVPVLALEKGGPGARKVRRGHYLVYQKKVAEAVFVYESKVVTKKKVSAFPIFPQNHGVLRKKKGLHFQFISPFPIFSPKSWCTLKKKVFSSM